MEYVVMSIRRKHALSIFSGEKRWEFRRRWTKKPVCGAFLYVTGGYGLAGYARLGDATTGTPDDVWAQTAGIATGLSRAEFDDYADGAKAITAIWIERAYHLDVEHQIDRWAMARLGLSPPRSWRFISASDALRIWNPKEAQGGGAPESASFSQSKKAGALPKETLPA